MLSSITSPSSTLNAENILSNSAPWANTFLEQFIPYVYIGAGIFIAFGIIVWFINIFKEGTNNLTMTTERSDTWGFKKAQNEWTSKERYEIHKFFKKLRGGE